jgi:hypothetical protein
MKNSEEYVQRQTLYDAVCTGMYWYIQDQGVTVNTSMYLYVPVHTRKSKMLTVHNLWNRTGDLLHSNQRVVPLDYQHAIVGVNVGLFEVYTH